MMNLDVTTPSGLPKKMIRAIVYPNITYYGKGKQVERDSFVQYLSTVIGQLNRLRNDIFWTIWMPEPVSALIFPNTQQIDWPLPTHAPAMRTHFDVLLAKQRLSHDHDCDLVWSHLPEATHALYATMANLTHHRPAFFGYSHWTDFNTTATWDGASFRENISGLLHMDRCYLNTAAQKQLLLREAAHQFSDSVCRRLDDLLVPQALGIPAEHIVAESNPHTDKIIVYNHRPDPYKDFPAFLKAMRELRTHRQDFTVWIPLLDTAPEPWISVEKVSKAQYYQRLHHCRVGVAPKQTYAGWSLSATDGLMNGCPFIFYDADYYKELHPTADTFTNWSEALTLLHRYLDDVSYRNLRATESLTHAATLTTEPRMAALSEYLTTLTASLPMRQTDATSHLVQLIRSHGRITKREIMKRLCWGRGIGWTYYRRALLAHPHIYDTVGAEPIYQWVE